MVAPWYTREIGAAMPSNIPATTIRIEPEVKREATAILDELGLSMSTAMNMFLRAVIREGGMPFEMKVNKPNE
jgi:DNA-damage-inducible protein J